MADDNSADRVRWRGTVESRISGRALLEKAGDVVLVRRGRPRWLLMLCPSGCGDELSINLDRRSGPAWRIRSPGENLTVYPSVWRDTGCHSHFIIWRGEIDIIGGRRYAEIDESITEDFVYRVRRHLDAEARHFADLALALDEDPWSVLVACRVLVSRRVAVEGDDRNGYFTLQAGPAT